MRVFAFLLAVTTLLWSPLLRAQVTDAERAAARELFKEGDELQRASKFSEALDKFQRAQKVYSAPTNVLRIAQCQAAVGQLVESAESYRATLRMPVPPGSPKAFDAAVEQAKTELAQVEPRVPKLVVQVRMLERSERADEKPGQVRALERGERADAKPGQVTAGGANPQLQIDGQSVSAALIGEPLPLDPGTHKVRVSAQGFTTSEQDATLKERETTTIVATLKPTTDTAPVGAALPSPSTTAAIGTGGPTSAPPAYVPPPPPPVTDRELAMAREPSRTGLLLGGHFGWGVPTGGFPFDNGTRVGADTVAGAGGLAYGFDGGLRFARHWYAGLAVEHAEFGHGELTAAARVSDASSSTTLFGVVLGFIANPDRASFYGQLGAGTRWFSFSETTAPSVVRSASFNAAELMLGAGVWLPLGRSFRLLPEATFGWGAFDVASTGPTAMTTTEAHVFWVLGLAGFYNLDF